MGFSASLYASLHRTALVLFIVIDILIFRTLGELRGIDRKTYDWARFAVIFFGLLSLIDLIVCI